MRADAQRNRDRIVEVARTVFREQGYNASLDLVAKTAGVGAGTLYRHFPTRECLVDAVLQPWVSRVTEATDKVLAFEGEPRELLLRWLETYAELITMHKGGCAKLTNALGDPDSPISSKCQVLATANERVIEALATEHATPLRVDGVQMGRMIGGVAGVAEGSELPPDALRPMLEVLADGLLAPA